MRTFFERLRSSRVAVTLVIGVCGLAMGGAVGISWRKSEVIPVILVKPGIGGFEQVEGSSIGNTWRKSEVKPVLLLKPGIGGFEPREGLSIGNYWAKQEVLPVMLVEPSIGGFAPLHLVSSEDPSATEVQSGTSGRAEASTQETSGGPVSPSLIESQIDGDFEGWEGETIVKLMNGQIWQQSEYHYNYHYAFMPKVMVFKSDSGYKMKVEGTDRAVGVTQLK
jgi:hypothetical protein